MLGRREPMAGYGVPEFIADVKTILADGGPTDSNLTRVAERMRELVKNPEVANAEATSNVHDGGSGSGPVFHDGASGLTLMRARFGPEAMTPIHNHGSWGVVGVYRGRDRYQVWRRKDGAGADARPGTFRPSAGPADVELVEERILEPGEAIVLPPPPQDIHAQQGHDGTTVHELVLFGANLRGRPRLYFDPDAKTAVEVMPGRS
jgi:predicted metal-dependent enzyme (double-stranded beta helix superfamily)